MLGSNMHGYHHLRPNPRPKETEDLQETLHLGRQEGFAIEGGGELQTARWSQHRERATFSTTSLVTTVTKPVRTCQYLEHLGTLLLHVQVAAPTGTNICDVQ